MWRAIRKRSSTSVNTVPSITHQSASKSYKNSAVNLGASSTRIALNAQTVWSRTRRVAPGRRLTARGRRSTSSADRSNSLQVSVCQGQECVPSQLCIGFSYIPQSASRHPSVSSIVAHYLTYASRPSSRHTRCNWSACNGVVDTMMNIVGQYSLLALCTRNEELQWGRMRPIAIVPPDTLERLVLDLYTSVRLRQSHTAQGS